MSNSQSPQRPDLQDLVAYIQGRGSETLRAQVLKRLDEDEAYMDLMIDLVPMLREAGECVDPDGEAEPAPVPLRLAPPPMAEATPAVAAPAGGKVIVAPDRFRRPPGLVAAAAMLPIAVALWIVFGIDRPETWQAAARGLEGAKLPASLDDPLYSNTRGGTDGLPFDVSPGDRFASGAWLVDLGLAIKRRDLKEAQSRLASLEGTVGSDEAPELLMLEQELAKSPVSWKNVERELETAYKYLFDNEKSQPYVDQGSCVRGAWLALRAGDAQFASRGKIGNRCPEIVGAAWPPTEKQLENMLDSQSVVLEPQR
jgi:hypothetical protein